MCKTRAVFSADIREVGEPDAVSFSTTGAQGVHAKISIFEVTKASFVFLFFFISCFFLNQTSELEKSTVRMDINAEAQDSAALFQSEY